MQWQKPLKNGLLISQIIFFWMGHNWKVIYYAKSEVLDLESNLLFLVGGGGSTTHNWKVIYYVKSEEVLDLESNLLFLAGG